MLCNVALTVAGHGPMEHLKTSFTFLDSIGRSLNATLWSADREMIRITCLRVVNCSIEVDR